MSTEGLFPSIGSFTGSSPKATGFVKTASDKNQVAAVAASTSQSKSMVSGSHTLTRSLLTDGVVAEVFSMTNTLPASPSSSGYSFSTGDPEIAQQAAAEIILSEDGNIQVVVNGSQITAIEHPIVLMEKILPKH